MHQPNHIQSVFSARKILCALSIYLSLEAFLVQMEDCVGPRCGLPRVGLLQKG